MDLLTRSLKERNPQQKPSKSIYLPTTSRNRRTVNKKKKPRHKSLAKLLRRTRRYRKFIVLVRERDNNRCLECGIGFKLTVHHIKEFADNPAFRFDMNWCDTLCRECHDLRHLHGNVSLWQDSVEKPLVRLLRKWAWKIMYKIKVRKAFQKLREKRYKKIAAETRKERTYHAHKETIGDILKAQGVDLNKLIPKDK